MTETTKKILKNIIGIIIINLVLASLFVFQRLYTKNLDYQIKDLKKRIEVLESRRNALMAKVENMYSLKNAQIIAEKHNLRNITKYIIHVNLDKDL